MTSPFLIGAKDATGSRAALVSGNKLSVLDIATKDVSVLLTQMLQGDTDGDFIVQVAFDEHKHLLVAWKFKLLQYFHISQSLQESSESSKYILNLAKQTKTEKMVTSLAYSTHYKAFVIGERSGQISWWSTEREEQDTSFSSLPDIKEYQRKTPTAPALLSGTCSIISHLELDNERSRVMTSDRESKIRVAYFPNAYNIEGFCLGHKEFVSRFVQIAPTLIASGGGDGTVRLWDLVSFSCLASWSSTLASDDTFPFCFHSASSSLFVRVENSLRIIKWNQSTEKGTASLVESQKFERLSPIDAFIGADGSVWVTIRSAPWAVLFEFNGESFDLVESPNVNFQPLISSSEINQELVDHIDLKMFHRKVFLEKDHKKSKVSADE